MRHPTAALAVALATCWPAGAAAAVTTNGMTVTIQLHAVGQDGGDLRDALAVGYTGALLCTQQVKDFGLCSQPEVGTEVAVTEDEWRDYRVKSMLAAFVDAYRVGIAVDVESAAVDSDPTVIGDPP